MYCVHNLQAQPHLNYVREHGVQQFINRYRAVRGIRNDELKWGDEVEYSVLKLDADQKKARVSLRAGEIREALEAREREHDYRPEGCSWHPEVSISLHSLLNVYRV